MTLSNFKSLFFSFVLLTALQGIAIADCTVANNVPSDDNLIRTATQGDVRITQRFTACESGPFTEFTFNVEVNPFFEMIDATVVIRDVTSASVQNPNSNSTLNTDATAVAYTEATIGKLTIPALTNGSQTAIIAVSVDILNVFNVEAGRTYEIRITGRVASTNMGILVNPGTTNQVDMNAPNVIFTSDTDGGGTTGQAEALTGIRIPRSIATASNVGEGSVQPLVGFRGENSATSRMDPALNFRAAMGLSAVPTMSEWGLLIFGLLVVNLGVFFVRREENILS